MKDELLWAAAWLYKASGNDEYLKYAVSNQGWSHAVSEFSWDNKFAGAQALWTKAKLINLQIFSNFFYKILYL